MDCIFTFDSIHRVMKAERLLLAKGIDMQLVPTPRQISSDCGMVIQVHCDDVYHLREVLREAGLDVEGLHTLRK